MVNFERGKTYETKRCLCGEKSCGKTWANNGHNHIEIFLYLLYWFLEGEKEVINHPLKKSNVRLDFLVNQA
jgi:hypothetical protein